MDHGFVVSWFHRSPQKEGTDMLGSRLTSQIMKFDSRPKADVLLIEVRTGGSGGGGIPKTTDFTVWRADAQKPWSELPPQAYLGAA